MSRPPQFLSSTSHVIKEAPHQFSATGQWRLKASWSKKSKMQFKVQTSSDHLHQANQVASKPGEMLYETKGMSRRLVSPELRRHLR